MGYHSMGHNTFPSLEAIILIFIVLGTHIIPMLVLNQEALGYPVNTNQYQYCLKVNLYLCDHL